MSKRGRYSNGYKMPEFERGRLAQLVRARRALLREIKTIQLEYGICERTLNRYCLNASQAKRSYETV